MERWDLLVELLESSLGKNGNIEITIQHLLNMMKMVDRKHEELEARITEDCYNALDWEWGD